MRRIYRQRLSMVGGVEEVFLDINLLFFSFFGFSFFRFGLVWFFWFGLPKVKEEPRGYFHFLLTGKELKFTPFMFTSLSYLFLKSFFLGLCVFLSVYVTCPRFDFNLREKTPKTPDPNARSP